MKGECIIHRKQIRSRWNRPLAIGLAAALSVTLSVNMTWVSAAAAPAGQSDSSDVQPAPSPEPDGTETQENGAPADPLAPDPSESPAETEPDTTLPADSPEETGQPDAQNTTTSDAPETTSDEADNNASGETAPDENASGGADEPDTPSGDTESTESDIPEGTPSDGNETDETNPDDTAEPEPEGTPASIDGLAYLLYEDGTAALTGLTESETLPETLTIPSEVQEGETTYTVTVIEKDAFKGKNLTGELVIPDTVILIGESAFQDNLFSSVTVGSSVETYGDASFYHAILEADDISLPETIPENAQLPLPEPEPEPEPEPAADEVPSVLDSESSTPVDSGVSDAAATTSSSDSGMSDVPKTGDNIGIWQMLALFAGTGLAVLCARKKPAAKK